MDIRIRRRPSGDGHEPKKTAPTSVTQATPIMFVPTDEKGSGKGTGRMLREELAKGPNLSIIKFVDALIHDAHAVRSSDIHIDPSDSGVKVRFRIDGVLQDVQLLPGTIHNEVISRLKILCGLRTDEH